MAEESFFRAREREVGWGKLAGDVGAPLFGKAGVWIALKSKNVAFFRLLLGLWFDVLRVVYWLSFLSNGLMMMDRTCRILDIIESVVDEFIGLV